MSRAFAFAFALGVAGALVVSLASREARADKPWAPCKGCLVVEPSSDAGPAPLLVTLHGDIDHADTTAAPWIPAIRARGWALLGIECPVAEGCDKGSFWRWNGPVDWLVLQIAAVRARFPVDGARVYVSGWSGGASYLGWHAKEISQHVAGIVIHGGGVAPPQGTCAPVTPPVYFLVGDQNPLHGMAKSLRTYFEGCGHPVTWDLLPRAGHLQELAALDRARADRILDALDRRAPQALEVPVDAGRTSTESAVDAATYAPVPSVAPEPSPPVRPPEPKVAPSSRGCATNGEGHETPWSLVAFVCALVAVSREKRLSSSSPTPRASRSASPRTGTCRARRRRAGCSAR